MKLPEIEQLLEKYYNGETTLEEERLLRDFFTGMDVPPGLHAEKVQFEFLRNARAAGMNDDALDRQVMRKISQGDGLIGRIMERKPWFYATVGMAATVLILIAIFIRFEPMQKKIQDTYSDPQMAYEEAKKVLFFVSKQFNRGTDKLQPLVTYNDGVKELNNLKVLNDGLTAASKIKKYNKIEQMMTNTN